MERGKGVAKSTVVLSLTSGAIDVWIIQYLIKNDSNKNEVVRL